MNYKLYEINRRIAPELILVAFQHQSYCEVLVRFEYQSYEIDILMLIDEFGSLDFNDFIEDKMMDDRQKRIRFLEVFVQNKDLICNEYKNLTRKGESITLLEEKIAYLQEVILTLRTGFLRVKTQRLRISTIVMYSKEEVITHNDAINITLEEYNILQEVLR